MKRPKSGNAHRIPPDNSGEPFRPTARVRARRNVVEAVSADVVEPGVEEAERGLALRNEVVVQQRNNSCHSLYFNRSSGCSKVDGGRRTE